MSGTLLIAVSCLSMAFTPTLSGWYGARLLTGIGMRLSLYDALFSALVNLYGPQARRTISRVTGRRAGVRCLLAAGRRLTERDGLAGCAEDLRPVRSAQCPASSALPAPALYGQAQSMYAGFLMTGVMAGFMQPSLLSSPSSLTAPLHTFPNLSPASACRSPSACCGEWGRPVRALWRCWQGAPHSLKLTLFTALAMPLCFLIGLSSDMLAGVPPDLCSALVPLTGW